jgi:hypothetical protein
MTSPTASGVSGLSKVSTGSNGSTADTVSSSSTADTVDTLSTVDALDDDPFGDDLSAELAKRAPRGRAGRTTLALGSAVLIVAGFLGGVVVQKNWGTASTAAAANAGTGNGGTGFAGRGGAGTASVAPGGQRGANTPTTGTVKFVDGTTIYLTNAAGETITVKTNGTTTIRTEQPTALADIPIGATVSVQGSADAQGTITASQLTATK